MKRKKEKHGLAEQAVQAYTAKESQKWDPNGSWTGVPQNKNEKPIQDADDL